MADRPILFAGPLVRAILEDRKTQTRRVLRPQPFSNVHPSRVNTIGDADEWNRVRKPFAVGDRLWVRETFARVGDTDDDIHACPDLRIHAYYRADTVDPERQKWRPSIHMPRWASRLTLIVEDVRVQRLQDINAEDAKAEGVLEQVNAHTGPLINCYGPDCPMEDSRSCNKHGCWGVREGFKDLWNSINGAGAWDANPWVVAVTFRTVHANIDALDKAA